MISPLFNQANNPATQTVVEAGYPWYSGMDRMEFSSRLA